MTAETSSRISYELITSSITERTGATAVLGSAHTHLEAPLSGSA